MTPQELQCWRLEEQLLQDELARLEAAMRAVLRKLRCPMTPVAIDDLLNGTARGRIASRRGINLAPGTRCSRYSSWGTFGATSG